GQFRARIVDDFIRRTDLPADTGNLALEGSDGLGDGGEDRKAASYAAHTGAGGVHRGEERREVYELERFENTAFYCERDEQRVEILRSTERDLAVAKEANGFRRGRERAGDGSRVDERLELRQTRRPGRRLSKAPDGFDDPVVFERPQGTGVHEPTHSNELRRLKRMTLTAGARQTR